MLGNFSCFCGRLLTFSKLTFSKDSNLSGTLSECQMVWIQIRIDIPGHSKSCVSGPMRILTWSSNVTSAKSPFSQAPGFIIISSINCAYKALFKENIKCKVNESSDKSVQKCVKISFLISHPKHM